MSKRKQRVSRKGIDVFAAEDVCNLISGDRVDSHITLVTAF